MVATSDVITVIVAVVSSLGAVTLSSFFAQFIADKKDATHARTMVAACLESVLLQSAWVGKYFKSLAGSTEEAWKTDNVYMVWKKEDFQFVAQIARRAKPFDVPFDKIRENLLDLDVDLADLILRLEYSVRFVNDVIAEKHSELSTLDNPETTPETRAEQLATLNLQARINHAYHEYILTLASELRKVRDQLILGKKKMVVHWARVDEEFDRVNKIEEEWYTKLGILPEDNSGLPVSVAGNDEISPLTRRE